VKASQHSNSTTEPPTVDSVCNAPEVLAGGWSQVEVQGSPHCWLLLNSGPDTAAWNMALDEALLERVSQLGTPVLRFYGWTQPAASFGYFQKHAEIASATRLRPLVRRPTGGGLVPHDADWTYSLVFPAGHAWHALRAEESYRRVHVWIQAAFARLGVVTELATGCLQAAPGQCFAGYEQSDVLWYGRKIAGAAQRRNQSGLLIQGSVQAPPLPLARMDWQTAMCDVAVAEFNVRWQAFESEATPRERAEELVVQKYSQSRYNEKR